MLPGAQDNFHVHSQRAEQRDQAIGGVAGETGVHQLRYVGLTEFEALGGIRLCQAEGLDAVVNLARELCLELEVGSVGWVEAEVGEDISGHYGNSTIN